MVTFELIEFVKNHLEQGTAHAHIRELLSASGGWVEDDIEQAFLIAQYGHHIGPSDEYE